MAKSKKVYWMGSIRKIDDFGRTITDVFIDGKTKQGPWAIMTPESFQIEGIGKLGLGQKYQKQENSKWLKIEG